jgi:hypothetical protein
MKKALIFFCIFFQAHFLWSQPFIGEALLPTVPKDGFYRILISAPASAYMNAEFDNIRIYDKKEIEIPFLLQQEEIRTTSYQFKDYQILEKKQQAGCCTSLILYNPDQNLLNNISLVIKNADVTKEATLLGSDDKLQWYALKQYFLLHPTASANGTSEIKIVDFPLSNYSYYSLRINDSTSAPINILKAGYFKTQTANGQYTALPLHKVQTSDSARQKRTYVHFYFDSLRVVDKLELSMKGQPYFLRKATLYQLKERLLKKGGNEKYYDRLEELELNSRHVATVETGGIKALDFLLVIENEDNPPLENDFVKAYQLNRYMTAWLEKENQYEVRIGNDQLSKPVYDLSFFKDSIPDTPDMLRMSKITVYAKNEAKPGFTFFTTKAFIWGAVVLVIVILGFMSARLLKETSSAERNK